MTDKGQPRQQSGVIIEPWSPGDPLEARKLNQPGDWIRDQVGIRPGRQVEEEEISSAIALRLTLTGIPNGMWLQCEHPETLEQILVARPWFLRAHASRHHAGFEFDAGSNTLNYQSRRNRGIDMHSHGFSNIAFGTQYIVPSYIVGDDIIAMKLQEELVFFQYPEDPYILARLEYIDVNVDKRMWAYIHEDDFYSV